MGTSKGYEPPKGKGSPWDTLKRQMGMLIEKPDKNTKVVSKFIKAIGGAENFSSYNKPQSIPTGGGSSLSFKSSTARNTVQGLGSFFSDISKNGLQQAAKSRGINIEGKTIDEIKELFIDFFLTPAIDSDSACASKAIETVMENLFNEIANEEELENILSNVIKTEKAKELVCGFYENYIYELFCRIFFEDRTLKTNQSDAEEILEIVKETISTKISGIQCNRNIEGIDFGSQEGSDFVQGILKDILEVLEEE